MSRPKVFVSRELPSATALPLLEAEAEVTVWPGDDAPPHDELVRRAAESDALLTMTADSVDVEVLDAGCGLQIVSNMAVGYDNVDVHAATTRGILVTNTPGVLTETTADLAFALILAASRRVAEGDRLVRAGGWQSWHPAFMLGVDVYGATLGIIGLGRIGAAVARRARGFDMRILYHDVVRKHEVEADLGVEFAEMNDLLGRSDFVSLHVYLSGESYHLIGERELSMMKPSAILINTSRGPVVDQPALYAALRDRRIYAAGLDVTETEPISLADPLLTLENVVITPHVGSASEATRDKMALTAVENILAVFQGRRPPYCVNPEARRGTD